MVPMGARDSTGSPGCKLVAGVLGSGLGDFELTGIDFTIS